LGTSKRTRLGDDNPFFHDRIAAAVALYNKQRVKKILVSGDNRTRYYNEPRDMLLALEQKGVKRKDVTLDYAGLRTLDSVVRCKEVFKEDSIIIVSQRFHAYRAVFIANYYGMDVQAYEANFQSRVFPELILREVIARTLAVFDLYILGRKPGISHSSKEEK
jgi:SanA protein